MNGGGANTLSDGYNKGTALSAEMVSTFVLVYIVSLATDPKRAPVTTPATLIGCCAPRILLQRQKAREHKKRRAWLKKIKIN